ncbi:MAG: hypothetical protein FJX77_10270 [Armatimonadetes bacterium]|nr:hypothetical protein [Armatimonadota bacterium]
MRRLSPGLLAGVAVVCLLFPLVLEGCRSLGAPPERVTLYLSGDTQGYLEPCGCRRDQAGGLPGRATVIRGSKSPAKFVLDAGNMTPGGRPYELLKLRYLLEGMAKIGYDAVNLGKKEAELDLPTLRQALGEVQLPYLSANVREKAGGKPLAPAFRLVTRAGITLGITGVTELDPFLAGPGVEVRPPLEALAEVIPTLRRQCDLLVVLAFVEEDTLREIAERYHEVNCLLGGDVPQSSTAAEELNRAVSFNVMDRGKVLGELELERTPAGYRAGRAQGIRIVGDRLPADPAMVALIRRYKDDLRERRYELASAEGMERIPGQESSADEFVGDGKCAGCHRKPHTVTTASKHHHAYETLVRKQSEYDPECLSCHTVGYGLHSGFVDLQKTGQLANVQCESCHGRGKRHVEQMQKAMGNPSLLAAARKESSLKPVTAASCIRCHDEENSENFQFRSFWAQIRH